MSEDIAHLGIRVDSTGAAAGVRDLQTLATQAGATERAALGLSSAFKSLGIAIGAVSFTAFLKGGIDALDNLNDLSLKTGIAVTKLAGLQLAAKQSGTSIDTFAHALNLLSVNMANNGQAFARLGISAKDPLQAFYQLAGVMESIKDPQTRAAVGAQALGRGWQELAPLLANGVAGLKDAVAEGEKLSGVTVQAAEDADKFNDQVEIMTTALGSLAVRVAGPVLDGFNQLSAKIMEATSAGITFNRVMTGISNFVFDTEGVRGLSVAIDEINNKIVAQKEKVKVVGKGGFLSDLLGEDVGVERNKLDSLLGERLKLVKQFHETTKKVAKDTSTETKKIDEDDLASFLGTNGKKNKANDDGASSHRAASKSHVAAMSEEEKAAQTLAAAYANLDESLKKQLALSKDTTPNAGLEYDLEAGSLSDLNEAQKKHLLLVSQEINNNEVTRKESETKKSEMESLIDQYNRLTLSARDYFKTQLEGKGITGTNQAPMLKKFDDISQVETTNAARESLEEYVKSIEAANDGLDAFGATSNDVFNSSIGGLNQLTGAFENLVKSIDENSRSMAELNKRKNENELDKSNKDYQKNVIAFTKEEGKLKSQLIDDQITGIMQIAGATGQMFEQGSTAAKAFNLIALAGLAAKAAAAILTQGEGEPYSAWARMAAMTSLVAGIMSTAGAGGFDFSSGGGGGSMSQAQKDSAAGTGTVLGDKETASQSIGNTYELLKTIHAEEYTELRGINRGIGALQAAITGTVTKIFQGGGLKTIEPSKKSASGLSALFGGAKYANIGTGISVGGVSAGTAIDGGDINASQFDVIQKSKKSIFGGKKFSYDVIFSDLDEGISNSLSSVFKGMGDVMLDLSKELGKNLESKIRAYIIPALSIDIKGLSGEDAAKKINGIISATMDTMATQVFGDIIAQYQQLGEGMLETAIRVVAQVGVVRDALDQSGMKMANNAIGLSDSLVQAAGGLEQFQKAFEEFYDKFFSDTEKQARLQTRLNEAFAESYVLLPRTREEYRKVMSALNLNNKAEAERYSLMLNLAGAADQYYSTLEKGSEDVKNTLSQRYDMEITWLKLTGKAAEALVMEREREYKAMDASLVPMQRIIDKYSDMIGLLESSYNTAADLLTATFTKFFNLAKSLVAYRDALKVGEMSTGSPESKYNANKKAFEQSRDIINAGPGKTALGKQQYEDALAGLQGLADKFLSSSRDYNASGKGYTTDFNDVIKTLTSGATKALNVASVAEKQLNALNDMVSGLAKINLSIIKLDGSIGKVDGSIKIVKSSTDKAPSATDLVRRAINGTGGLIDATKDVTDATGNVKKSLTDTTKAINSVYDAIKGLTAATVAMNKLQADRDKAAQAAAAAEAKAAADRAKAQKALDEKRIKDEAAAAAAAVLRSKQNAYAGAAAKADVGSLTTLAQGLGFGNSSAMQATAWSNTLKGLLGGFDESISSAKWGEFSGLFDEYRVYIAQLTAGLPPTHDANYFNTKSNEIKSHANGLDYVPYDGYMARLHKGERVQTANQAGEGDAETKRVFKEILLELKAANRQRGAVAIEAAQKTEKLLESQAAQIRALRQAQVS